MNSLSEFVGLMTYEWLNEMPSPGRPLSSGSLLNKKFLVPHRPRPGLLEVNLEQAVAEAGLHRILIDVVGKTEATRDLSEGTLAATTHPISFLGVMSNLFVGIDTEEVAIDFDIELLLANPSELCIHMNKLCDV